jgi:hypothetical protein
MKTNLNVTLILAASSIILFTGCATTNTGNTKSLLSQAGFRARAPQTAKQRELYAALPSDKIEHAIVNGKVFYVYKDEKAGVAYVGGEQEHRRYQQLCTQQHVAQPAEEDMSHPFARNWSKQWGGGTEG